MGINRINKVLNTILAASILSLVSNKVKANTVIVEPPFSQDNKPSIICDGAPRLTTEGNKRTYIYMNVTECYNTWSWRHAGQGGYAGPSPFDEVQGETNLDETHVESN